MANTPSLRDISPLRDTHSLGDTGHVRDAAALRDSPPHSSQPLLKTPFHERARALSQVDSFIAWAGYSTVDVFTTAEQEYFAIRNAASLYDLTPMVKYRIAGPGAERFLNRIATRNIAKLREGRVAYTVWC